MKTLDGTITRKSKEDDSLHSLSMKCTDINLQMFHNLGVSKPILNYVIFCHQEDANWPLDEGSKVKDKFDEIFASAKYKDALKKIKEVRANHMQQEKIEKKELEYLSSEKKEAKQKKKTLKDKENAKKVMEDEITALEEQSNPIRGELKTMDEVEMNYNGIRQDMVKYESDLKNCKREIVDLKPKVLRLLPDNLDDGGIKQMKIELDSKHEETKSQLEDLSIELERVSETSKRYEKEIKQLMGNIGQCDGFRKSNEKNNEELLQSVNKIAAKLNWNVEDSELSENTIVDCKSKLNETISQFDLEKWNAIGKFDKNSDDQNKEINKLTSEKAQLEEQKRLKREERSKTQKGIAQIKRVLCELQGSETKLKTIMENLDDKEVELNEAKQEVNIETLKIKIKDKRNESEDLNEQLERIKEEKQQLESQREIATQISLKTKDLNEKQRKLDRTLAGKNSELTLILGNNIPDTGKLKEEFDDKRDQLNRTKIGLESKIGKLTNEIESKRLERKNLSKEIDQKESRIKRFERELQDMDLMEVDQNFEEQLQQTKDEVEKTRLELEVKQANKYTYQEFIDKINKMQASSSKSCCPTCNRNFDSQTEANEVKRELENDIKRIPSKVQSIQNKLLKLTKRFDKFQSLLPEKKQTDEMKNDLLEKRKNIANLDRAIKMTDQQLSENQETFEVVGTDYSVCDDLRDYVSSIDQLFRETSDISGQITKLKTKSPELSKSRDYIVVKNEEETISQRMNALRREVDHCQSLEIGHEKKLTNLERERNNLLEEKLHIQRSQQERTKNQEKRQELEGTLKDCERVLLEIDQNLQPIQELMQDAHEKVQQIKKHKERTIAEMEENINEFKKLQYDIEKKHQQSVNYQNSGNEEKFASYKMDYDKANKKKKEQEATKRSLETEKSNLQTEDSNRKNELRNLDDNIKLRGYKQLEYECTSKLAKYKDEIKSLDYESNDRRRGQLTIQYNSLERQKQKLLGRLGELDNTIEELEEEISSDKYSLAESRYRKKSIEARCRYHVINDLNKYYIALDWAIMRFHQERMRVINRIIRELWRATYRGNDIDYIEIDTDDGSELSMAGADKRKVVNYRVVMVKNETKLDMRGRCSAGQKVLASLIIRLALAETFSTSCGMIALDEPTTNLDRENIESLAQALADLVAKRSIQRNFQLIVITHDEELIDQLSRIDQVDYYYRVSRDEKGRSIIRRNLNNMR